MRGGEPPYEMPVLLVVDVCSGVTAASVSCTAAGCVHYGSCHRNEACHKPLSANSNMTCRAVGELLGTNARAVILYA